jgi:coenzyme F420 hydrogenase subunit beta
MQRTKADERKSISVILKNRICCGCGACSVICPTSCISIHYGQRYNFPRVDWDRCKECGRCLKVCPSAFLLEGTAPGLLDEPAKGSLGCFLIHSNDNEIRLDGSSGGFITGMLLHLMNRGLTDGAIVVKTEGKNPLVAESFIATDRPSVLSAQASKYAPVSSCTALAEVLKRPGCYVFVGTPCMVEGLNRLQRLLPELKRRIVLSIGLVCAGMASRLATRSYIEEDGGVKIEGVRRICYRGNGWPGRFRVFGENGKLLMDRPLIGGSLHRVVGRDHYLRCENCLDHWARSADIIVSDPWTEDMIRHETKGRSAIMVRTERGKAAVNSAIVSGEMTADPISVEDMLGYNRHLILSRDHPRHSWMGIYQLLFFGRLRYLAPVLRSLLRKKPVGLRTTLKARLNRVYYY